MEFPENTYRIFVKICEKVHRCFFIQKSPLKEVDLRENTQRFFQKKKNKTKQNKKSK